MTMGWLRSEEEQQRQAIEIEAARRDLQRALDRLERVLSHMEGQLKEQNGDAGPDLR